MQIILDISEEDYLSIKDGHIPFKVLDVIRNATALPKGHGRLFDERDIVNGNYEIIGNRIYELEPIIEADRSDEE